MLRGLAGRSCDLEGCDVLVPVKEYKETHCFPDAIIDAPFCKFLAGFVGTVNASPYRGFDTCEMLFSGVSGTRSGLGFDEPWIFTFCYSILPNIEQTFVFFDGSSKTVTKGGWDKFWPYTECKENEVTGEVELTLSSIETHRVYLKTDFSVLNV